jgi:hypothetical protein
MSTARDLLADLAGIGARIEPAGKRIILRAGPTAIPAALVRRVREAKADLLATLAVSAAPTVVRGAEDGEHGRNSSLHQAKDQVLGSLIVEWLNQHSGRSVPGRCACCGRPDSPSAVVVPLGRSQGRIHGFTPNVGPLGMRRGGPTQLQRCAQQDPLSNDHDR